MPARKSGKSSRSCRILVVDDHPVFRQGITQLINNEIDCEVVGEAEDARNAMALIERLEPDLVLADISLKGSNGIELAKCIRAKHTRTKVLILSMHDEALYAERALRAGARGYLMKRAPAGEVLDAIKKVMGGEIYLSGGASTKILSRLAGGLAEPDHISSTESLSDRELEVLEMIGEGKGTREIAGQLGLSVKTIESHRMHIKEKLGIEKAPELVRFAVEWRSRQL